jgi:hypothetical protein
VPTLTAREIAASFLQSFLDEEPQRAWVEYLAELTNRQRAAIEHEAADRVLWDQLAVLEAPEDAEGRSQYDSRAARSATMVANLASDGKLSAR